MVAAGPPGAAVPPGSDDRLAVAAGLRPCPAAVPDAAAGFFIQSVVELAVPAAEPADTAAAADMGLPGVIVPVPVGGIREPHGQGRVCF